MKCNISEYGNMADIEMKLVRYCVFDSNGRRAEVLRRSESGLDQKLFIRRSVLLDLPVNDFVPFAIFILFFFLIQKTKTIKNQCHRLLCFGIQES